MTSRIFSAWGEDPLEVARNNKLLDLYLETQVVDDSLAEEREECRTQRLAVERSVAALGESLRGSAVDWAVFKTLRPFPFTPSDVDAVVFPNGGARALADSLSAGSYAPAGEAPHTVTVCDTANDVGIDFYQDIAASWFVYVDRSTLRPYLSRAWVGGVEVPVLRPVAEVLTILAHATYKEQLFTLADYLTLRHYAESFGAGDWADLLSLAEANGIRGAVTRCLRITMGIAEATGDAFPWQPDIKVTLGSPIVPARMPYWLLSPWTLGLAVLERASVSARARSSLGQLATSVVNPTSKHSRALYRQLWLRARGHIY